MQDFCNVITEPGHPKARQSPGPATGCPGPPGPFSPVRTCLNLKWSSRPGSDLTSTIKCGLHSGWHYGPLLSETPPLILCSAFFCFCSCLCWPLKYFMWVTLAWRPFFRQDAWIFIYFVLFIPSLRGYIFTLSTSQLSCYFLVKDMLCISSVPPWAPSIQIRPIGF